ASIIGLRLLVTELSCGWTWCLTQLHTVPGSGRPSSLARTTLVAITRHDSAALPRSKVTPSTVSLTPHQLRGIRHQPPTRVPKRPASLVGTQDIGVLHAKRQRGAAGKQGDLFLCFDHHAPAQRHEATATYRRADARLNPTYQPQTSLFGAFGPRVGQGQAVA